MGAYLSEPKTTKESSDSDGVRVRCGASSMQGWRISQEDAHNCILEFDKNASLFAVYDGHGGHEVAEYCSKNLPDFIKQTEKYTKGEFEQALKDAFLDFDATLATPEVISVLKVLASGKDGDKTASDPEGSDSEEDEAIDNLVEEAHMPLDEVMAKYKVGGPLSRVLKGEGKPPVSPMLRARRTTSSSGASSSGCSEGPSSSSSAMPAISDDAEVSSSSSSHKEAKVLCNGDAHVNGEVEEEDKKTEVEAESSDLKKKPSIKAISDKCDSVKKSDDAERTNTTTSGSGLSNGESHDVSSSTEKIPTAEGSDGITSTSPPKKKRTSSADIYQKLLTDESDSEEEDETFQADAESDEGSSDEAAEGEKDAEGDDDDDGDDEEDSSLEDEEDDEEYPGMEVKEEPGSDSGCTAVVALLMANQLYVANAGDSRCVVCREGQAVEMSFDHKPEDEPERERIETAGGKVTCDGRVNGGLNLSRAIGDHSYKQVKLLPASKQMITALPDVRTLSIEPSKDEFMVLACDGIWNSMTSQEVVDFVRIKLQQKTEKLSQICEELFDHCLAPNTQGDGTGCDNMTCVIVQFKDSLEGGQKRQAEEREELEEPSTKRSRVDEPDTQPQPQQA